MIQAIPHGRCLAQLGLRLRIVPQGGWAANQHELPLGYSADKPLAKRDGWFTSAGGEDIFNAAFCDGHVSLVPVFKGNEEAIRAQITRTGGESVSGVSIPKAGPARASSRSRLPTELNSVVHGSPKQAAFLRIAVRAADRALQRSRNPMLRGPGGLLRTMTRLIAGF